MSRFNKFYTLVANPMPEKRIASAKVTIRMRYATGNLYLTDLQLEEGGTRTGYELAMADMYPVEATTRYVNAIVKGNSKHVLYNGNSVVRGLSVRMTIRSACQQITTSQGIGAQRLVLSDPLAANSSVSIDSDNHTVSIDDALVDSVTGFFPYLQDGFSTHLIDTNGEASVVYVF